MLRVTIHRNGYHVTIEVRGYNPDLIHQVLRKDLMQLRGLLYVGLDLNREVFSVEIWKEHEETIISSLYQIVNVCNLTGIVFEERGLE